MTGFKIIGEMTKDEMIDEIMARQREILLEMPIDQMKKHLIHKRTVEVNQRLIKEAELEDDGPIGFLFYKADE